MSWRAAARASMRVLAGFRGSDLQTRGCRGSGRGRGLPGGATSMLRDRRPSAAPMKRRTRYARRQFRAIFTRMCTVCFSAAQVVPLGALYARARLVSIRERRAQEVLIEDPAVDEAPWDDAFLDLLDPVEDVAGESEVVSAPELVASST